MKPIIYSSKLAKEAIELEEILFKTNLKNKVEILYIGKDYKHEGIPSTLDYENSLGKYIPTFVFENTITGNVSMIIKTLTKINA
jgi:hypothetical protein